LGVANVTLFAGAMPRTTLPEAYASADVFAMPSTTETQGLVLAEAMAAGLPVIAADAPQNRDVVGETADLVDPEPRAFAAAFDRILMPRDEAAAAATRGRAERFSLDRHVDGVVALYESLVRPARSA
jgi:glycosyltransferase involved in cell wall biosynthesis